MATTAITEEQWDRIQRRHRIGGYIAVSRAQCELIAAGWFADDIYGPLVTKSASALVQMVREELDL